ncbi:MAG: ATP-binding protein [Planctomycetota bacterium]
MKVPPDFGVDDGELREMSIPNDLRSVRQPEIRIMKELLRCGYDADTIFGVKLALEEALANAVRHGNQCDSAKEIIIRYHVNPARVVIMVRDQGCGFSPGSVPDPTAEENIERPSGRGIMLMQSYMTKVRFNKRGNEVWLLKEKQGNHN